MISDRMKAFLSLVKTARWRDVPKVWSSELREALNKNLVRSGWGGVLELTEIGKDRLSAVTPDQR
jgi:hypothetical protein